MSYDKEKYYKEHVTTFKNFIKLLLDTVFHIDILSSYGFWIEDPFID